MSRASKLSLENQSIAFRMHAEGNSPKDICKYFDSQDIPHQCSNSLYSLFKSKCHQAEIEKFREQYYARIKDVPIAHKRTRLEVRQEILDALKKLMKKILGKSGDISPTQFKKFVKMANTLDKLLVGAQDEIEKKPGTVVQLTQHFGDKDLTMEELRVEEQSIDRRLAGLQARGIRLPTEKT